MKKENKAIQLDQSTEEKIKTAAAKVFVDKGFSGARTRDIAEEAGINLALLNYYFRSKENLYNIVIMDKLKLFFDVVINIVSDSNTTFEEKFPLLVEKYTDLLLNEPNLPMFLLSELKQNPDFFSNTLHMKERINLESFSYFQKITGIENRNDVVQLLVTFLSVTIFPFVVRTPIQKLFDVADEDYTKILLERKRLIPLWMNEIVKNRLK